MLSKKVARAEFLLDNNNLLILIGIFMGWEKRAVSKSRGVRVFSQFNFISTLENTT
jgi:hypothetical protein